MRNFERQIALFGRKGQDRIEKTSVLVVGIGGIGTHVVQQLALLGVKRFTLIDPQELDDTNRNRYIGARFDDSIPGTLKVDIGERIIRAVDPKAEIRRLPIALQTEQALNAVESTHVVFGCVDRESLRFILNHWCVAFGKPLFDSATGIDANAAPLRYGGHVFVMWEPPGCIVCRGNLDMRDVNEELAGEADLKNRESIYGVDSQLLANIGPSVVSLNGIIASVAVTEFMVAVTGLRKPNPAFTYWGHTGKTSLGAPAPRDCFTCSMWKQGHKADPRQFLGKKQ
jgi:hypothetical protein